MNRSKKLFSGLMTLALLATVPLSGHCASPWTENEGYWGKTGGKLVFGLKHTFFGWMNPWAEAHDPDYPTQWTGFCAGIGKSVVYTAAGIIQLVTFPIPVDFPDVGLGMHIPANHQGGSKGKPSGESESGAAIDTSVEMPAAPAENLSMEAPALQAAPAAAEPALPPGSPSPDFVPSDEMSELEAIMRETEASMEAKAVK